ncbi:MAG: 1-acyl-sn-glycerol-3-phosphate acyltransferase [Firmicutes bacterium]|nr:1-acyl-sn-glycerol-3-phosphate acyltransferase [Candidatus Colimorpha enterica]
MKIKVVRKSIAEVRDLPAPKHKSPKKSLPALRLLMKTVGAGDLKDVSFKCNFINIPSIPDEPCLVLMNHSAFIDLEIASSLFYPKPLAIVCTSDGLVGKEGLMRNLGCIPTNKFVTDPSLISDIGHAIRKNRTHVLMYPEASYTFDGCATPLPKHFGVFLKLLKAHVLMITTHGAFLRDPLYNMLQKRKVHVEADVKMLFTADELKAKKADEIDEIVEKEFTFDGFGWQKEQGVEITEPFRADGLERILYKCPVCGAEGRTKGEGTHLKCSCGLDLELSPLGELLPSNGEKVFAHIPDWYRWEREEVRKEIENGEYDLSFDCRIIVFRDFKAVYDVGRDHLTHDLNGFTLTGEDGLEYHRSPTACYSLYADYYWYEIGDMVCIGDNEMQFYCFPDEGSGVSVAKARLAAEEMYKMMRKK